MKKKENLDRDFGSYETFAESSLLSANLAKNCQTLQKE